MYSIEFNCSQFNSIEYDEERTRLSFVVAAHHPQNSAYPEVGVDVAWRSALDEDEGGRWLDIYNDQQLK